MTRREKFWFAVVVVANLINLGGAVYAGSMRETMHFTAHLVLVPVLGALLFWLLARGRRRETPTVARADERLGNLQMSLDAVAIELERIGEAQRFSAKLQAEQAKREQ